MDGGSVLFLSGDKISRKYSMGNLIDLTSLDMSKNIMVVLGPLHTQDQRPTIIAFQDLTLVKKAKTIQVHFTLEGEAVRPTKIILDEKSTWIYVKL